MILAVLEMLDVGKASAIGWKTVVVYLSTTLAAAIWGVLIATAFKPLFTEVSQPSGSQPKFITLGCNSGSAGHISESTDGSLLCSITATVTKFLFIDLNKQFKSNNASKFAQVSISESLRTGIFIKMVPANIITEFGNDNFFAIITFSSVFAWACFCMKKRPNGLLNIFEQIKAIFVKLIEGIIMCTPYAVTSLVAGAIAKQTNLSAAFKDIGLLMAGAVTAFVLHAFFFYPLLLLFTLRKNPFSYLKFMIPAQTFAFASASSAATLPVTMKCVERSGEVPANIRNFVLSLGSTVNMDGTACYLPMTVTFMAVNAGLANKLDAATYILIAIMATFGSIGTAPVPSASLVIMLTTYSTAFGDDAIPTGFAYIVAIDWLMDRFRTMMNVTGDSVVARCVAEWTKNDGITLETDLMEKVSHNNSRGTIDIEEYGIDETKLSTL
eukprot:CAMPEP_0119039346 /NCGR_PEP_ID=MMETSP1177-20130426/8761_1 /TAXON_ID=2985 /ORGANISM="Ochromonas sp, Strain CCMP1899" /LENGTH=439 /DNA_ID=CAMNT_0007003073 /DNA_START=139 /DNA_END=1458 /DNA_ORIENTATION=+